MSTLVSRLRGIYPVGKDAEFGNRDFSSFIPPIAKEAASRIEALEEAIDLISSARHVSENPLDLIDNICDEVKERE